MEKYSINDYHRLYRRTKRGAGRTGYLVRIELRQMQARTFRVLSHVTIENETNDYTKCRLGIRNGGKDHYLDESKTIAAAELLTARSDVLLGEGDVFFAEFTGTTDNDVLIMTCVGWEKDL